VFPLTGKCFPLINFSKSKQTHESLESGFPESELNKHGLSLSLGLVSFFVWIYASVNGFMKSQLEGDGDSSVGCSYAC
jgi:hypothetical protein